MTTFATPARRTAHDDLLERYLRARDRYGEQERDHDVRPDHDVRTCAHCGAHTSFLLDPAGGWATCEVCHRAA